MRTKKIHTVTRRTALKQFSAIAVLSQIPLTWSCSSFSENKHAVLSADQIKMLQYIQQILFPDDGFGPGAMEINADRYLEWVLSDERMDAEDKDYILKGFKWVDEAADETYHSTFLKLKGNDKVRLIKKISRTDWGESWLSVIMNYILEALLADPQYGGNPEQKGWKWLSHYPGYPRPSAELLYPEILNTLRKDYEQTL